MNLLVDTSIEIGGREGGGLGVRRGLLLCKKEAGVAVRVTRAGCFDVLRLLSLNSH